MTTVFDDATEQKVMSITTQFYELIEKEIPSFKRQVSELMEDQLIKERQSHALKLLKQFPLSDTSGLALMSLCECYPRIKNNVLRQKLLKNTLSKLPGLLSASSSLLNLEIAKKAEDKLATEVVNKLSSSFVCAQSLDKIEVLKTLKEYGGISIDCLGEAAQTKEEADFYIKKYQEAFLFCQKNQKRDLSTFSNPVTMSIKLSALITDFNVWTDWSPLKEALCRIFQVGDKLIPVNVAIDAEEANRSALQREVLNWLANNPDFSHISFSIAQQAYLSEGLFKLDEFLSQKRSHKIGVRIVKGAYYDYEIRESQRYRYAAPVFSSKDKTDSAWLLMSILVGFSGSYLHLASHNPESIAQFTVIACHLLKNKQFQTNLAQLLSKNGLHTHSSFLEGGLEFQYLYGMGGLRQQSAKAWIEVDNKELDLAFKAYAPIGSQKELLPYLVRRLLENGVNNSVWQNGSSKNSVTSGSASALAPKTLVQKIQAFFKFGIKAENSLTAIPKKENVFTYAEGERWWESAFLNKAKISFNDSDVVKALASLEPSIKKAPKDIEVVKNVKWIPLAQRAASLKLIESKLIKDRDLFLNVLVNEVKKHPLDALGEWQEAMDFVRYYQSLLASNSTYFDVHKPTHVAGEFNHVYKVGMPSVLCISPWNFPLAITLGQLCAAVCAGSSQILLKPSPKLNKIYDLIAYLFESIPSSSFEVVQGTPAEFEPLIQAVDCVLFTGSTKAFEAIKRTAASASNKTIGETGGVNCAIIDGSIESGFAADVLARSSFNYSGQKCSCIRVAFIDESIYDEVVHKLKGFDIKWGDGLNSFGRSVIDEDSKAMIADYCSTFEPDSVRRNGDGYLIELDSYSKVKWIECFGPVLQLVKVNLEENESYHSIKKSILQSNSGLTATLLSKDEDKIRDFATSPVAGNQYINRGSTGAIVQAQPFGGFRNSGTGPKIGTHLLIDMLSYEISVCMDGNLFGGTVGIFEGKKPVMLVDPVATLR